MPKPEPTPLEKYEILKKTLKRAQFFAEQAERNASSSEAESLLADNP